jgi:hypothetical protein
MTKKILAVALALGSAVSYGQVTKANVPMGANPAPPPTAARLPGVPAPVPPPAVVAVTPKESLESVKLQLNRSKYQAVVTQFQEQQQQAYFQQVKPALDNLDAEEQDLIKKVRTENGWDDSYVYDVQKGAWEKNTAVKK